MFLAAGAAGLTGDGGLDSKHAPGSDGAGITTTETATGPSTIEQMTPGATATDAGDQTVHLNTRIPHGTGALAAV